MNEKYWSTHNIPEDIAKIADNLDGLMPIATGGGMDYVALESNPNVILASQTDASPDGLNEPSSVIIYVNEIWDSGVEIQFPNALLAMLFMSRLSHHKIIGFPTV